MGFWDRLLGARRRERARSERDLAESRARLEAGDVDGALARLRPALLEAPRAEAFVLAAELLRRRGDRELAELFDRAADAPEDVERAFELGSQLLDGEDAELASAVLSSAMLLAPFDAVLRSEAAIALARCGRPREVVETLALHPNLADDPGALFEFAWASLLVGDVETARASRDQLASLRAGPRLLEKLDAALRRSGIAPASDPPDARDYYFLEHGGLLLDAAGPSSGRYEDARLDGERVGDLVARAAAALPRLWPKPRRVMPASADDQALAEAMAAAVGGDLTAMGAGRAPAGLVVVREGRALEALDPRVYRAPDVLTFALALQWDIGLSHAPDFVGIMARRFDLVDEPMAAAPAAKDAELSAFVEARRDHLAPAGRHVHTAYLPDAPLG